MSKFHSTISRRNFMKALGLAGAGLGAAAVATPVMHDLDELASSANSVPDLPWWVKERDHFDPTVPIDWDHKWRVDGRNAREYNKPDSKWFFNAYTPENTQQYQDYLFEEDPDFEWCDPRRKALEAGCGFLMFGRFTQPDGKHISIHNWLGYRQAATPETGNYQKWVGTPEENLRLLRGAVRYYGGDDVGVMEHDSHLDRIICTYDMDRYKINFVNDSEPTETQEPRARNIPNSWKWAFVWTLRQPIDNTRRQQGAGGAPCGHVSESAGVYIAYSRLAIVENRIQEFLRGLGYGGVAGGMNAMMPGTALATLSGMLEHGRMGQVAIHPKYGATIRGTYKMFTNLPLPPTRPVDAGIYEFCKSCGICAEHCPGQIIQRGEPTWTTGRNPADGDDGEPLPYQAQGFLGWRTDIGKCPHCPVCQGTCPFNVMPNGSFVHDLVRATVSTTSILNGFFVTMDRQFDYGRKPYSEYWENFDKQPTYHMDTMRNS